MFCQTKRRELSCFIQLKMMTNVAIVGNCFFLHLNNWISFFCPLIAFLEISCFLFLPLYYNTNTPKHTHTNTGKKRSHSCKKYVFGDSWRGGNQTSIIPVSTDFNKGCGLLLVTLLLTPYNTGFMSDMGPLKGRARLVSITQP